MISSRAMTDWLSHRTGVARKEFSPIPVREKALNLNDGESEIIDTYGNQAVLGYVGFIDIIASSGRLKRSNPAEFASYFLPFMNAVIEALVKANCLIDKTIGDEIMFVLPDTKAELGIHINYWIGRAMGELDEVLKSFSSTHPVRMGIALGSLFIGRVGQAGYQEWTVFGETVNLAKRLHSIEYLSKEDGFRGAFGVLAHDPNALALYDAALGHITLTGMRWPVDSWRNDNLELKGISPARVGLFRRLSQSDIAN